MKSTAFLKQSYSDISLYTLLCLSHCVTHRRKYNSNDPLFLTTAEWDKYLAFVVSNMSVTTYSSMKTDSKWRTSLVSVESEIYISNAQKYTSTSIDPHKPVKTRR